MDADADYDPLAYERLADLLGDYGDAWKGESVELAHAFGRTPRSMLEMLTCSLGSVDHPADPVDAHEVCVRYLDLLDSHEEYRRDASWLGEEDRLHHRAASIHGLHCVEALATWLVLRAAPDMWSWSDGERRALFLNTLYAKPAQFEFFSARQNLVDALALDGLLERVRYMP